MTTEYGNRLRLAMEYAKLTQKMLVAKSGKSQSSVSSALLRSTGSAATPIYAKVCGVDGHWLATGEGNMIPVATKWQPEIKHLETKRPDVESADFRRSDVIDSRASRRAEPEPVAQAPLATPIVTGAPALSGEAMMIAEWFDKIPRDDVRRLRVHTAITQLIAEALQPLPAANPPTDDTVRVETQETQHA